MTLVLSIREVTGPDLGLPNVSSLYYPRQFLQAYVPTLPQLCLGQLRFWFIR
jgi:hypothetical protein